LLLLSVAGGSGRMLDVLKLYRARCKMRRREKVFRLAISSPFFDDDSK
jgi:hypothetical protein